MDQPLSRQDYLQKILLARIYDLAKITPLQHLDRLSERLGCKVLLKREDYQQIHAFKIRGAYNRILSLTEEERARGVITASAGNHAQGVALSARKLGMRAVIVMPTTTPDLKIEAVRRLGAEIVLQGDSFNEAYDFARSKAAAEGMAMIPPYDDPDVIAGQGTIAHEIIGQCNSVDTIFVQIGGGGLAAGVAVFVKALLPEIKVVGVEAEGSASMKAAFEAGGPVDIGYVSHFADGVAVSLAGTETYRVLRDCLDDIVTCSNDEICAAMKDIFDDTRAIAEPSGALSLAGLKKYVTLHGSQGGTHVAILSGANVKFHTLRTVAERCDVGENLEGILSVEIPEVRGSFRNFCEAIGERHVTEFSYRLSDASHARVLASIELSEGRREISEVASSLKRHGYLVTDLTMDSMAKDHVRYMVGGHPQQRVNERLYLFEFPETRNALTRFLETLGDMFSITLFHFRIAGLEYCSVLCGFDVSENEEGLELFLRKIGYTFTEVTSNTAYQQFLR
ncbi:MAG: threonine ammonia-lyase, biosynthetic [Succinivibrionaceae bacterium]|nr:threonine ammonia-lyase, biosynthetic [Succinivibrionaceae bacterium]